MIKGYAQLAGSTKGWETDTTAPPPQFSLTTKELPEIKSWQVGKTYTLEMDVKLVAQRKDSFDSDMSGTFEVQNVQEDDDDSDGGDDDS